MQLGKAALANNFRQAPSNLRGMNLRTGAGNANQPTVYVHGQKGASKGLFQQAGATHPVTSECHYALIRLVPTGVTLCS